MQHLTRFVAFGLLTVGWVMGQERFSDRLTAAEKAAAGLDQLSASQLAALDALVQKDHERGAPAAAPVARSATEGAVSRSEVAPEPPRSDPPAKRRHFGLPVRDETNEITGVLDGDFTGWHGATIFRMQDGQVWVQEDKTDQYDATPRSNPRVTISKSMFGGYKLAVEGVPGWVRVRRLQ